MGRVDRQGRQDGINLGVEVLVEIEVLGVGELVGCANANPVLEEERANFGQPDLVEPCDEVMGARVISTS